MKLIEKKKQNKSTSYNILTQYLIPKEVRTCNHAHSFLYMKQYFISVYCCAVKKCFFIYKKDQFSFLCF